MIRYVYTVVLATLVVFGGVGAVHAKKNQTILNTQIVFDKEGKATVSFTQASKDKKVDTAGKIESALIFYAFAMKETDDKSRMNLLNQVQRSVSKIATEGGLMRPDLLKNNSLIKTSGDVAGKGYDIILGSQAGVGNTLEVKPIDTTVGLSPPAVFYYFQKLVEDLPDEGLRLMVLAMGGMNKWYREVGKATDPNSVSAAPSYGLNIAVDILSKISGKKI